MTAQDTLRPRYWHGQYLRAEDFEAAIDYHRAQLRRHHLGHHTWGIVSGLVFREEPRLGSAGVTDLVLQPGVAIDGYGRLLVVPAEHPVDVADFAGGRDEWVQVWLEYDPTPAVPPAEGFAPCAPGARTWSLTVRPGPRPQPCGHAGNGAGGHCACEERAGEAETYRTHEGYRLLVGPQAPSHEDVVVDGRPVEQDLPFDESVPFQELPADEDRATWLVPLGHVPWNGVDGFRPRPDPASDPADAAAHDAAAARGRRYVGLIGDHLYSPGPTLRIAARPDGGGLAACDTALDTRIAGSVTIECSLGVGTDWRADVPVTVRAGADGQPALQFHDDADAPAWLLQLEPDPGRRGLALAEGEPGAATTRLFLEEGGRVGVGTTNPDREVTIVGDTDGDAGTYLNAKDTATSTEVLLGADANGGIVSTMSNHDLQLRAGSNVTRMTLKAGGRVGIGTVDPDRDVTLESGSGAYLNARDLSSGVEVLVGADGAGGIVSTMTGHDLQLRAGGNSTKLTVKSGGRIGIGTTAPDRDVTVQRPAGAYLNTRDTSTGVELLIGADFNGGIVSTMTNHDLVLRAGSNIDRLVVKADGDVGIGTTAPATRLHVAREVSGPAGTLGNHVAVIENTSDTNDADVLALKIGLSQGTTGNNFVSFFHAGNLRGRIEGNGVNGVRYETTGGDFAEWLPRVPGEAPLQPGDVVAVIGGEVTRATAGAVHVSVVATAAGFAGGARLDGERDGCELVTFIGQAPVRVEGPAQPGDLLVPSGRGDGMACAIRPADLAAGAIVIGEAWEGKAAGDGLVRACIGPSAAAAAMRALADEVARLSAELAAAVT